MLYPESKLLVSFISHHRPSNCQHQPLESNRTLNVQLQDLMSLALATSMQGTYSRGVKRFLNFCMEHGVQPLPADKLTLVYFAVALSRSLIIHTIKVYLSEVGSLHHRQDPMHHNPQLKMVLRGTDIDRSSQPITRAVLHKVL